MKTKPDHPEEALQNYLHQGEELQWSGSPKPKEGLTKQDWSFVVVGLLIFLSYGAMTLMFFSRPDYDFEPISRYDPLDSYLKYRDSLPPDYILEDLELELPEEDSRDKDESIFNPGTFSFIGFLIPALFMFGFGFYFVFGRHWLEFKNRKLTVYGLSGERLLIVSGIWSRKCSSYDLTSLTNLCLEQHEDGTNVITFGSERLPNNWMNNGFGNSEPKLILGTEAEDVYRQIRNLLAKPC